MPGHCARGKADSGMAIIKAAQGVFRNMYQTYIASVASFAVAWKHVPM